MGRKKYDKKNAHRFVVLHRSQLDPEYYNDEASKLVLHPADKATAKALKNMGMGNQLAGQLPAKVITGPKGKERVKEFREVDERGFPIDGYNYEKHLAPITGGSTFISASGEIKSSNEVVYKASSKTEEEFDELYQPDSDISNQANLGFSKELFASEREHDRMLEAITLRPDRMDPELRALLEEDNGQNEIDEEMQECVGTLEDDFMEQLLAAEAEAPDESAFDYEQHIARLMNQAGSDDEGDSEFEFDDDYDDDAPRTTTEQVLNEIESSRPVRDVDLHFEAMLAKEYGDDEIGELEHGLHDERVAGVVENDNLHLKQLVDEFLVEKRSDIVRGKEYGATDNNRDIREIQHAQVARLKEKEIQKRLEIQAAKDENSDLLAEDDAESVLSDASDLDEVAMLANFGYQDRPKEVWDCETIVSTYSILDNHPRQIVIPSNRRKPKVTIQEDSDQGDNTDDEIENLDEAAAIPYNAGVRRNKKESAEEKRLRKKMIKEQQRLRRNEKKSTKLAFKTELKSQKQHAQALKASAAPPNGVSTFKF